MVDEPRESWSGRAEVPVGPSTGGAEPTDWGAGPEPTDRWWLPIAVGLLALLLFILVAVGSWWLADNDPSGPVAPSPSPSLTGTATPTVTSDGTATATPGSDPSPSPSPSVTPAPTGVPLPVLIGLPQEVARHALDRLGLAYRLRYQRSDQPVGTVIDTEPRPGELVGPDDQVTLVIAEPAVPTTTPAPGPTTPTADPAAG